MAATGVGYACSALRRVFCCGSSDHASTVQSQAPSGTSSVGGNVKMNSLSTADADEKAGSLFRSYVATLRETSCLPRSVIDEIAVLPSSSSHLTTAIYQVMQEQLTRFSNLAGQLRIALMQIELSEGRDSAKEIERFASNGFSENSEKIVDFDSDTLTSDLDKLFEFATVYDLQETVDAIQQDLPQKVSTQVIWDKVIKICIESKPRDVKTDYIRKIERINPRFKSFLEGAARVQDLSAQQFSDVITSISSKALGGNSSSFVWVRAVSPSGTS